MASSMTFAAAVEAAMTQHPGVVRLSEGVGPEVLTLPVADRGNAAMALGMCLAGTPVVLELADTGRLGAVIEVLTEAASIATKGDFSVPLVIRVPYGTHGLDTPVGRVLTDLPGLQVLCPSGPERAAALMLHALQSRGPTLFLESRALASQRGPVELRAQAPAVQVLREGQHLTIVTWGVGVQAALSAAEALSAERIEAQVVELACLHPLDHAALGEQVRRTGRLVVAHPHEEALATSVRFTGLEGAFLYLESPLAQAPATAAAIAQAARDSVYY